MPLNTPIKDWHAKTVWIVGASSGIGRATASLLHSRGAQVIVSARSSGALQDFVREHPGAKAVALDVTDRQSVAAASAQVFALGALDGLLYCAGHYRPMLADAIDLPDMLRHLDVNYVGALNLLDATLPHLLQRPRGSAFVSLISSVAGYRGLPNSLAYGPTKAALINMAQTLYLDLHDKGLGVSLINPGFVETPLTAKNTHPMPALITPQQAAAEIVRGWAQGRFEIHFPKRFTLLMKTLELLPYRVYFYCVRKATRS
ncbi:MAG: SDR family NAD(P)-dependent oxidoreductase [Burkholderiaceae bacterium]